MFTPSRRLMQPSPSEKNPATDDNTRRNGKEKGRIEKTEAKKELKGGGGSGPGHNFNFKKKKGALRKTKGQKKSKKPKRKKLAEICSDCFGGRTPADEGVGG